MTTTTVVAAAMVEQHNNEIETSESCFRVAIFYSKYVSTYTHTSGSMKTKTKLTKKKTRCEPYQLIESKCIRC